jgi:hypothetical protein
MIMNSGPQILNKKAEKSFRLYEGIKLLRHLVFLLIHPWPFFDILIFFPDLNNNSEYAYYAMSLSEINLAIAMFRSYFLYRSLLAYSHYNDPYSRKLARMYGFDTNFKFVLRSQFR